MYGKGATAASNDHFPWKGWGEFQDKTFFQEELSWFWTATVAFVVSPQMAGGNCRRLRRRNFMRSSRCAMQNRKRITLMWFFQVDVAEYKKKIVSLKWMQHDQVSSLNQQ